MAGYIALFPVVVVFVLESSVQDKLWSQLPLTKAVTTETCSHRCEFSKIHNYKLRQMTPSRWQTAWLQETKDSRLEQIFPEDRGMANTQNTTNRYWKSKEKPLHPLKHSRKALTIPRADKDAKQHGGGKERWSGHSNTVWRYLRVLNMPSQRAWVPPLRICPKKRWAYTWMYMASLSIRVNILEQPKCPLALS